MGRFNPYQLTDWHRDNGAALVDLNRSLPIGRYYQISSVQATLVHVVEIKKKATVVYGKEIKLSSIQGYPLELPEEIGKMFGVKCLAGWLMYTEEKNYKGYDLIVTEFPLRNLYFQGRLELSRHRKKSEIIEKFRGVLEKTGLTDPIHAISKGLSSIPFQPFESRSDVVSAWLIEPKRVDEIAKTQRSRRGKISFKNTERDKTSSENPVRSPLRSSFDSDKAEWSLGICENVGICEELLGGEEKEALLTKTTDGELFEGYRDSDYSGRGPVFRFLKAIAVDLREHVFKSAVMTALAGIDEDIYPGHEKGSPKPVMKQVGILYHRFMYALVQRCDLSSPVPPTKRKKPENKPELDSLPSLADVRTEREKIEDLSDILRLRGRNVVMARLEKTADEIDGPDEPLARLILAVPEEWPLPEKLVAWFLRYQSEVSEEIQELIEERLHTQEEN